jgi:hypothetical protein
MQTTTILEDSEPRTVFTCALCVLYIGGAFGYRRVECRNVTIERKRYAQHDRALIVEYVERGKRKPHGFACYSFRRRTDGESPGEGTTVPFVVVDASIDMPATFEDCGAGMQRTRHLSCSPIWNQEFHVALTASGARLLFDGRDGGRT